MHPLLNVALMGHSSSHEEFTYAFGLYRLKAYCEQLGLPHALTVFDRASDDDEDEDFALLCKHAPDVIGLSAYIWSLPRVVRLVSRLRQALPEVLIVVGGPSASGFEELAIDASRPDLLVIGFGERTFANILTTYAAGELDTRIEEVGDLISHRGEHPIRYRLARPAEDLDAYPSPYLLGMIDPKGRSTLYIETDRGCPYSCAFCIESTAPNKVSRFSLGRLAAELGWALEHGVHQIELCSALLNLETEWLDGFVSMVERVDPEGRLAFSAALYTTHMNARQAELFGRLNLKSALFGLNSIHPATFKGVRRVIRPERFRERIEMFTGISGRRAQVSLIMGLPGDTPQGLATTLEFATTLDADVMLFRFMVLPNTLYYEDRAKLHLEIDFAHANRILSSYSYSREDFADMEKIAALAGFDQINPGEWVLRSPMDRFSVAAKMPRKKWNLLYLTLQAMELAACTWPAGWSFKRPQLQVGEFVGLAFESGSGQRLHLMICERNENNPAYAQTRFFNLAFCDSSSEDDAEAEAHRSQRAALFQVFIRRFDAATARVLTSARKPAASRNVAKPAAKPAAKRRLPVVGSGRAERAPVVDADGVADKAAVAVGNRGDKSSL